MKICAVYKITNTITGDFYIGSSKDVKKRWREHKKPSTWKNHPDKQLYQDMKNYGIDKFELQILAEVEPEHLKETEQQFIETLKPTYNDRNAKGWDTERYKERHKERNREYRKTHRYELNKYQKEYRKSNKFKEYQKEYNNRYTNQLCCYNGETITLNALSMRFRRQGIPHPTIEAKKYIKNNNPIEFYDVYP